jgi:hypothetical protein
MKFKKQKICLLVFGVLIFSALNFCYTYSILNNGHNWGGDFALYISQAKAIVNGNTYNLYEASKASCDGSYERLNPDVYPLVFPLMLSPIYALFNLNFVAFKILVVCCFVVFLCTVCYLIYKKLGAFEAILIVGLLATSNFFIVFNNNVLADVPAMMWIWLGIIIYLFKKEKNTKTILFKFFILGLVLAVAFHTKTLSISVVGSVLLTELIFYFQNKITLKNLIIKSISFSTVFISVYIFVNFIYPSSSNGYIQQSSKLTLQIVIDNIWYYTNAPSWFLYDSNTFVWLTFPFVVLGVYHQVKQNIFLCVLIFVHFLLLILWPYQQGLRFLIFLVPIYYYFACIGYTFLYEKFVKNIKLVSLYKLHFMVFYVIIFYSIFIAFSNQTLYKTQDNEIMSNEAKELFEFVNTKTKYTDKFIFFKPNVLRLICNRESIYVLNTNAISSSNANYWIYKQGDKLADTTGLKIMFNNNEFLVFKLK